MNIAAYLYGMSVSFSLIVAIGAQNAFILKQGLKRQFVLWICLICAVSDSILILAGVFGFGKIISQYPLVLMLAKYAGALFLFGYGAKNLYSAITQQHALNPEGQESGSLWQGLAMCMAFTWLNPHVYLDTVVLLGAVSAHLAQSRWEFSLGAMSASWLFFFSLGYGARLLQPLFAKPMAWKVLDFIIGLVMWGLAISLIIF